MKSKKGMEMSLFVSLFVTILAFFALAYVFGTSHYDIEQELSMTRASLLAAERYSIEGMQAQFLRASLYLRTHSVDFPESGYKSTKEDVMANMANRIVDCWWAFGNGAISEDVLGQMFMPGSSDRCFVCMIGYVKKLDEPFEFKDLLEHMGTTPYKATPRKFKYCDGQNDGNGCISQTVPECEAKGGVCIEENRLEGGKTSADKVCPAINGFTKGGLPYPKWQCKKKNDVCCVKKESMMTYIDYLASGNGALIFPNDFIKSGKTQDNIVKEGYQYAIAFKDQTTSQAASSDGLVAAISTGAQFGGYFGIWGLVGGIATGAASWGIAKAVDVVKKGTDKFPQGMFITPYPGDTYGNCEFVKES